MLTSEMTVLVRQSVNSFPNFFTLVMVDHDTIRIFAILAYAIFKRISSHRGAPNGGGEYE